MTKAVDREVLAMVEMPDGKSMAVYMPTIGEVIELNTKGFNHLQALVISATGLTWETYEGLPFIIGCRIINALQTCFDEINNSKIPDKIRLN